MSCDLATLDTGVSIPIDFTLTPNGTGTLTGSGAAFSTTSDPDLNNNDWDTSLAV